MACGVNVCTVVWVTTGEAITDGVNEGVAGVMRLLGVSVSTGLVTCGIISVGGIVPTGKEVAAGRESIITERVALTDENT